MPLAPWDDVEAKLREQFPDVEPGTIRTLYEQAAAHQRAAPIVSGGEDAGTYLQRRSIPGVSSYLDARAGQWYSDARRRIAEGNPQEASYSAFSGHRPSDYDVLAQYEAYQRNDQNRGLAGNILSDVARIPAIAGEAYLASRGVQRMGLAAPAAATTAEAGSLFGRAGARAYAGEVASNTVQGIRSPAAWGRTAAQTALMPSMWEPQWVQSNVQNGRDALDPRGLPAAYAMGFMNTAVLGSFGGVGDSITRAGVRGAAERVLARTATGILEQQGVDVMASAVSEFLPEAYKLQTGYGLVGSLVRGEGEQALHHAVQQAVTFGAFSVMHGLQEPHQAARQIKDILDEAHKSGAKPEEAAQLLTEQVQSTTQAFDAEHQRAQGPQPGIDETSGQPAQPSAEPRQPAPIPEQAAPQQDANVVKDAIDTLRAVMYSAKEAKKLVEDAVAKADRPFQDPAELVREALRKPPQAAEPGLPEAQPPTEAPQSVPAGQPARPTGLPGIVPAEPGTQMPGFMRPALPEPAHPAERPTPEPAAPAAESRTPEEIDQKLKAARKALKEASVDPKMIESDVENIGTRSATEWDAYAQKTGIYKNSEAKGEYARWLSEKAGMESDSQPPQRQPIPDKFTDVDQPGLSTEQVLTGLFKKAGLTERQAGDLRDHFFEGRTYPDIAASRGNKKQAPHGNVDRALTKLSQGNPELAEWIKDQFAAGAIAKAEEGHGMNTWDVNGVAPEPVAARVGKRVDADAAYEKLIAKMEKASANGTLEANRAKFEREADRIRKSLEAGQPRETKTPARPSRTLENGENTPTTGTSAVDQPSTEGLPAGPGTQGAVGESAPAAAEATAPAAAGAAKASRMTDADIAKEISRLLHRGEDAAAEPYRDEQARRLGIEGVKPAAGAAQPEAAPLGFEPMPATEHRSSGGTFGEGPLIPVGSDKTAALAKEKVKETRASEGLAEIEKQASQSDEKIWQEARGRLMLDPGAATRLAHEVIQSNGGRALNTTEKAMVLHRMISVRNELSNAIKESMGGKAISMSDADYMRLQRRVNDLKEERNIIDKASDLAGSESGRTLRIQRMLSKYDYSLAGMLQQAESAKKAPLTKDEQIRIRDLQTQIESLQAKLDSAEDRLSKSGKGTAAPEFGEWKDAEAKANKARQQFQSQIVGYQWQNMSTPQKVMDWIRRIRIAEVISSPVTVGKIGGSSVMQTFAPSVRELIGSALRMVPGLRQIAERAPVEGRGFSLETEKAAIKAAGTQGFKDALETLRTGQSELDLLHGPQFDSPRTWLDYIGSLHAAEKAPAVRGAYERAFRNIEAHEREQGNDVTSPAALRSIGARAYAESARAKFQQDNALVDAINKGINHLKKSESMGANALGVAADVLLPVRRTPTNIIADALEHVFGLPVGAGKAGIAWAKGIENLTPHQADSIMRMMKKGTLGLPLVALGYYLSQNAGGFYSGRRNEEDLKPGEIKIGSLTIPAWATAHHPMFMALQLGATAHRAQQGRQGDVGLGEGAVQGLGRLFEEVPLVRMFQHGFGEKEVEGLAKSLAVPQLIQWAANLTDRDALGNTRRRTPHGFVENVESGIPGLRQRVPLSPR